MENTFDFKLLASIILVNLSSFANDYGILSLLIFSAVVLDIFTGVLKAKARRDVSSQSGFHGLWRKLAILTSFVFGLFLDNVEAYLVQIGLNSLHPGLHFSIPFGRLIGVYIVLNECLSIFENLNDSGVKIPTFIAKMLKTRNESLDDAKKSE